MQCLVIFGVTMTEAVYFMRQVNEFIASNPNHPIVVDYNRGEIGLGYIIRHWQEIYDENYSNMWKGQSR
jgi:hypothetical protein